VLTRSGEEFLACQASMTEKALPRSQPRAGNYGGVDCVRPARSVSSGLRKERS